MAFFFNKTWKLTALNIHENVKQLKCLSFSSENINWYNDFEKLFVTIIKLSTDMSHGQQFHTSSIFSTEMYACLPKGMY